jgi:DNA-binding protein HU-beta
MNRADYVKAIAQKTGYTQKDVKAVIDAAQEIAYNTMASEDEVKVFDGLTLIGVHKDATTARNPMDGSTVNVPAKTVPKAKWGKAAKDAVNLI